MRTLLTAVLLLFTAALTGCATGGRPFGASHATEFRHPDAGEMKLCLQADTGALVLGAALAGVNGLLTSGMPHYVCVETLIRAGYLRVPIDAEGQAALDRYDAARADSLRGGSR
jgi:hypothetical protein